MGIKYPNVPMKLAIHQIKNFGFLRTSIPKLRFNLSILVRFTTSGNSDLYVKHNKADKTFIHANIIKDSLRPYESNINDVIISKQQIITADKKFVKPFANESFLLK